MNLFRVVQLNASGELASGYLIRNNLILTAHHPFRGLDDIICHVRFLEDIDERERIGWNDNACRLVWSDDKQDMALLQLTCDLPISVANKIQDFSVPRFGKFENQEIKGKNMGIGFINYQDTSGSLRSKELTLFGRMRFSIQAREIELYLDQSLVPSTPTAWEGISGTAFFANGYLVGVTKKTDGFLGEKALCAIAVSQVYEDSKFCSYVFAGENKPSLYSVTENLSNNESIDNSSQLLDDLLLNLNYDNQQRQIADAMRNSSQSQVFLLPPNGKYAQQWLVKRLSRNIINYSQAKKFELRADSSWNETSFLHEWENRLSVEGYDGVMTELCSSCHRKRPLIITIHDIDQVDFDILNQVLHSFWESLLGKSGDRHKCILFLTRNLLTETSLRSQTEIQEWNLVTREEIDRWVDSQQVEDFLLKYSNQRIDFENLHILFLSPNPNNFLFTLWRTCNLKIGDHFKENYNE